MVLSPEDQRDTTVPSTLFCPVSITSSIYPLCPYPQIFWGRWVSLKPSRFLFTIEKIGAFTSNKDFAFPFPNYYDVSTVVLTFYKTLGFRFTMEVFHRGSHFLVSKLKSYIHKIPLHLQQERRCLSFCLRLFQDSRVPFHHGNISTRVLFPVSKLPRFFFIIEKIGAFAHISSFPVCQVYRDTLHRSQSLTSYIKAEGFASPFKDIR